MKTDIMKKAFCTIFDLYRKQTGILFVMFCFYVFCFLSAFSNAQASDAPVSRSVLNNEVILLMQPADDDDIVSISVVLKLSVFDEGDQKVGIRSFLASLIHEKVMSEQTPTGIKLMELMGVVSTVDVTPDYMIFNYITTPRHYKKVLQLLSSSLTNASFDEALFKKTKESFVENTKSDNGGFSNIYDLFLQCFYRYHPYKTSENINSKGIEKVTKEKIEDFMKKKISSNNLVIAISGNMNQKEIKDLVEKSFSTLTPVRSSRVDVQWEPQSVQKEIFLSSLSQMCWILYGFPAPSYSSPDYPAMKVLKTILSDGLNSRLWMELREKRGLAYDLGSSLPELEGPSYILIHVNTQPKNVIASRRLILKEIENIKELGVTSKELADAKAKIYGSFLLTRESMKGQTSSLAITEAIGGEYSIDQNIQRKVEEVSSNDIKKVAKIYFHDPTLLVIRPPGHFYIDWFE